MPSGALPTPSLDEWVPSVDAAVKRVAAQLARSRHYHPMLLSAPNAGTGALPSSDGESGGMMAGLVESIPFIGKGLDVFESAWQVPAPRRTLPP